MSAFTGDHKHNVFVPTFAPQFKAMCDRGGIPGVSVENSGRAGVWGSLEWLQMERPAKTWKRFSTEELQAKYGAQA
jgi:hypothetical protein